MNGLLIYKWKTNHESKENGEPAGQLGRREKNSREYLPVDHKAKTLRQPTGIC
jgi:hypothetical protein